jgi:hypothetical protein
MKLRSLILMAVVAITPPAYADEAMTVAQEIVSNWQTASGVRGNTLPADRPTRAAPVIALLYLLGLVDIAVQQLKAEPFGAGVLQETLRLRTRLLDVGRKPGDLLQLFLGRAERRAGKDDSANRMHVSDPGEPRRAMPAVDRQGQRAAHPGMSAV